MPATASVLRPRQRPSPRRLTSTRRWRLLSRGGHLAAAVLLGLAVYGPPAIAELLLVWLRILVIPALGLTGLMLWKQAQLRHLLTAAQAHLRRDRLIDPSTAS